MNTTPITTISETPGTATSTVWILSPSLGRSCKASTPRCVLTDNVVLLFPGIYGHENRHPTKHDQLAYAQLIIREALCHGGAGWLDCFRAFCQQAAVDPSLQWNTLLLGLLASTMLGRGTGQGALFCTLCGNVDHTRGQCALLCVHPPTTRTPTATSPVPRRRSDNICMSWNRGACIS